MGRPDALVTRRPKTGVSAASWRSALVTGASSGIGEQFARQIAAAGVDVVLVARRVDRLDALARELRELDVVVEVLPADLSTPAGRAAVAARLADPERPIDLLVNNAGLGVATAFAEGDADRYREIIDINIVAVVELTHAVLPTMLANGRGWVLNVSSLGGLAPGPGFAVYSATKAFVCSFSESLHEECRRRDVVVTAVCPGATRTEFGAISGADDSGLPPMLWQEPGVVVAEALGAAAAGRALRVTGWPNRLTAGLTAMLPRIVRRRLAGMVTDQL